MDISPKKWFEIEQEVDKVFVQLTLGHSDQQAIHLLLTLLHIVQLISFTVNCPWTYPQKNGSKEGKLICL